MRAISYRRIEVRTRLNFSASISARRRVGHFRVRLCRVLQTADVEIQENQSLCECTRSSGHLLTWDSRRYDPVSISATFHTSALYGYRMNSEILRWIAPYPYTYKNCSCLIAIRAAIFKAGAPRRFIVETGLESRGRSRIKVSSIRRLHKSPKHQTQPGSSRIGHKLTLESPKDRITRATCPGCPSSAFRQFAG